MPDVARAVERNVSLQVGEQRQELLPYERQRILERVLPFAFFGDDDFVFGMEIAPPEDAVAERLQDEALQHVGVFGLRPQEPGVEFRLIHIHKRAFARSRPAIDVRRRRASLISSSWLHGIARYFGSTPVRGAAAILLCSTNTGISACSLLARRFPSSGSRSVGPTSTTARSCLSPLT